MLTVCHLRDYQNALAISLLLRNHKIKSQTWLGFQWEDWLSVYRRDPPTTTPSEQQVLPFDMERSATPEAGHYVIELSRIPAALRENSYMAGAWTDSGKHIKDKIQEKAEKEALARSLTGVLALDHSSMDNKK